MSLRGLSAGVGRSLGHTNAQRARWLLGGIVVGRVERSRAPPLEAGRFSRVHGSGRSVTVSGKTLLALAANRELDGPQLQQAKKLMRFVLHHYIGDRPLASRSLFRSPVA